MFRVAYFQVKNKIKCMGLLYKRGEFVYLFLRYVVFIGICTQDYHFQIKKTVYTFCFKSVSQDLVFDSRNAHSIDISDIFMLGLY